MSRLPRQLLPLAASLLWACAAGAAEAGKVDFNRDIRPLLAENCLACHGPDAKQRKAKLRLDVRADALAVRAFVPGQPAASELVRRITAKDADLMPPPDSRKRLTSAQQDLLRRWIAEGAEYAETHWAYRPIARPPVPRLPDGRVAASPLDAFIAAKLAERGLHPVPEADRTTLVRRLSFDLTGLPPTPEEVAAFVADPSPDFVEKLADRLLASPRYGERMAMRWLDLVRYADSRGYHSDFDQPASPFRDYVINAFNQNKPFDRFTTEQIAGDLLTGATEEQRIASGYNMLLATTDEGGVQDKEYRVKYAADRVRNAAAVWLGSTLGCAECHDHKYDPFTQRDFYRFAAFFADLKETVGGALETAKLPLPAHARAYAQLSQRIKALRTTLATQTPELDAAQAAWEQTQARWRGFPITSLRVRSGTASQLTSEVRLVAAGARKNSLTLTFAPTTNVITGLRLQIVPLLQVPADGELPTKERYPVVHRVELSARGGVRPWGEFNPIVFTNDTWQGRPEAAVPRDGWEIRKRGSKPTFALFRLTQPLRLPPRADFTLQLDFTEGKLFRLETLRASFTSDPQLPSVVDSVPLAVDLATILARPPAERSTQQRELLAARFRALSPLLTPAREQLKEASLELADLEDQANRILAAESTVRRVVRILPRGNWLNETGDIVTPGAPAILDTPGLAVPSGTRLDLARWLGDPENPLVARVFVNRLWREFFGRGLVTALDDFGARSTPPSHPELLDWLAAEFIASGWDVKHMVRLIVRSAAYRRASREPPELRRLDPDNSLVARQGRFRLEAELVRDNALAAGGLLVEKLGGLSVRPYQPTNYWDAVASVGRATPVWKTSTGEDLYRRSLYTFWRRSFLHPSLLAFDAPVREECVSERTRSNTPQQALVLLNDPTFVEAARALAGRVLRAGGGSEAQRIQFLWRLTLSRDARPEEVELMTAFYRRQAEHYADHTAAAEALLKVGAAPVPDDLAPPQLAAWTQVARAVLNLHETITRN